MKKLPKNYKIWLSEMKSKTGERKVSRYIDYVTPRGVVLRSYEFENESWRIVNTDYTSAWGELLEEMKDASYTLKQKIVTDAEVERILFADNL